MAWIDWTMHQCNLLLPSNFSYSLLELRVYGIVCVCAWFLGLKCGDSQKPWKFKSLFIQILNSHSSKHENNRRRKMSKRLASLYCNRNSNKEKKNQFGIYRSHMFCHASIGRGIMNFCWHNTTRSLKDFSSFVVFSQSEKNDRSFPPFIKEPWNLLLLLRAWK